MSEVTRFVVDIQGREARECVFAADHDRIVASLVAGREAAERENESLRAKAQATEQTALELRAEVERLRHDLATAHADASYYASTTEEQRAEVEALRKDAERYRLLRDRRATASWEEGGVEVRSLPDRLDDAVDESIALALEASR